MRRPNHKLEFGLGGLGSSFGSLGALSGGGPAPIFHAALTSDLLDAYGVGTPTFTRATAANMEVEGILIPYASGEARIHPTYGLLMEGATENECLYSEDLTNAAWAKSNITVNSTSTIDPFGNSSTTIEIEATAGNGTILQTVTKASEANTNSVYLKRVSGTGNVDITIDGGSTWATKTLTSQWQRFEVTQTLANPQFGVRIVTSGDKVAMDCSQLEDHPTPNPQVASSYVGPTTSAAVTRNLDQLSYAGNWDVLIPDSEGALFCKVTAIHNGDTYYPGIMSFRLVTAAAMYHQPTLLIIDDGTNSSSTAHQRAKNTTRGYATRWSSADSEVQAFVNGTAATASGGYVGSWNRNPLDTMQIGWSDTNRSIWGYIKELKAYQEDPGANFLTTATAS